MFLYQHSTIELFIMLLSRASFKSILLFLIYEYYICNLVNLYKTFICNWGYLSFYNEIKLTGAESMDACVIVILFTINSNKAYSTKQVPALESPIKFLSSICLWSFYFFFKTSNLSKSWLDKELSSLFNYWARLQVEINRK